MLVCSAHGFAFLHVPKTGGTSIKVALMPYADPGQYVDDGDKLRKERARRTHDVPRPELGLPDGLRFMGVYRDPFERIASAWGFLRRKGLTDAGFEAFAETELGEHQVTKPQTKWLLFADDVLRFERLEDDFADWCEARGLPRLMLERRVSSGRRSWDDVHTPRTRELIASHYAEEIERWG